MRLLLLWVLTAVLTACGGREEISNVALAQELSDDLGPGIPVECIDAAGAVSGTTYSRRCTVRGATALTVYVRVNGVSWCVIFPAVGTRLC